ncbi:MAG: hypothetical protein A2X52_17325 [Candidatus Rokubacteria bacterium GWC2_70_16]|nr:MAG: hypothetical protein A2X52_17325 [Candidatus Rokubacteria bacterium GWC2_70_16]
MGEGAPGRAWTALWLAVALVGIAAVAMGWVLTRGVEQRVLALDREAAALRAALARDQAFLAMLRDPAARSVALAGAGPSPDAHAWLRWHPAAGGLLVATALPPVPAGRTYQLWAIGRGIRPVSGGIFSVDAQGRGTLRVPPLPGLSAADVFSVTLERAGGAPAPSGPAYLVTGR